MNTEQKIAKHERHVQFVGYVMDGLLIVALLAVFAAITIMWFG